MSVSRVPPEDQLQHAPVNIEEWRASTLDIWGISVQVSVNVACKHSQLPEQETSRKVLKNRSLSDTLAIHFGRAANTYKDQSIHEGAR
jgi:hypothetical protein